MQKCQITSHEPAAHRIDRITTRLEILQRQYDELTRDYLRLLSWVAAIRLELAERGIPLERPPVRRK